MDKQLSLKLTTQLCIIIKVTRSFSTRCLLRSSSDREAQGRVQRVRGPISLLSNSRNRLLKGMMFAIRLLLSRIKSILKALLKALKCSIIVLESISKALVVKSKTKR